MTTQTQTPSFLLNRDLFSNHYLMEHLPETDAWDDITDEELREARDELRELWEDVEGLVNQLNESSLESNFIRPVFNQLRIPFEVEQTVQQGRRRPDYAFFETRDAIQEAFDRVDDGGDFYRDAIAVADAKRWDRALDTRGAKQEDYENPSYQIDQYLRKTETTWAVLTNGKHWRLYYKPTSHRLDSYFEVDLPELLENGGLDDFKYFYLFFRHEAFVPDTTGDCFLDDVHDESNTFAQALGEDLRDNIYEAIKILAEGFLHYPENDLDEDDLGLIHDSSLIYLYRLIFVLYAEAEGRELLDTDNDFYEDRFSLNALKQEVAADLDSADTHYPEWDDELWTQINKLFELIDEGSKAQGIPEDELHVPAYNGGLFRTDPAETDDPESVFLAKNQVSDAHLAEVIDLLTRSQNGADGDKTFVDYSSLDIRHLGGIYEGLLEYQLNIADEPLAVEDGQYTPAEEDDEIEVVEGEVYLTTDSGERKATGSYYTPEYVVEYIVENTLGPLVDDIREDLVASESYDNGGFAEEFANRVFELKILDPAMGSGHFLTSSVNFLAREIIQAQERQAEQQGIETVEADRDIYWARRQVAQRCIYGVDVNPLAVELSKVSLWLRTLAAEQPLAFLDHHLKTGNSLVGSDIEQIEELESDSTGENTTLADFGIARKGTIEQLMRIYQEFIAIENQNLEDVKEMEAKYDEFERNKLRQRLEAIANVHTAEQIGEVSPPSNAYQRMAAAIEDDEKWQRIEEDEDWFTDAQSTASQDTYFHWKIEYPEVFYTDDGSQAPDAGFDAVIGNPPYMRIQTIQSATPHIADYYRQEYLSATGNFDIYVNFTEQGFDLLSDGGLLGFIEPHKFFQGDFGAGLRQYLADEKALFQITSFGHKQVWEQVSVYTCILILRKSQNDTLRYTEVDPLELHSQSEIKHREVPADYSEDSWVFHTEDVQSIIDKIDAAGPTLEEITDIFVGLQTSADRIYLLEITGETTEEGYIGAKDQIEGETWYLEPDLLKPFLKGEDVHRYEPLKPRYWVIFPYHIDGDDAEFVTEDEMEESYPRTYEYLCRYEDDLRGREGGKMDHDQWYDYVYPKNLTDFQKEKIVTPEISYGPNFTYDADGVYHTTKVYGLLTEERVNYSPKYLLAVLNNPILWFFLQNTGYTLRGGYFTFKTHYLNPFSVPEIPVEADEDTVQECIDWYENEFDDKISDCPIFTEINIESGATHDFTVYLVDEMIRLKDQHDKLNLEIFDYLGTYDTGKQLGNISGYQPSRGISNTIFSKTAEDYDSLRIGDVKVSRSDSKVIIEAAARYKPENPDEYSTDRWGYTQTELQPVMEFIGLSEEEETLLREFVPIAVDRAGGFAEFRENATKSMSIMDRLQELTLPELNDVIKGLSRYLKTKDRANSLEHQIALTDDLLNQIVYELYSFQDDEVSQIEAALE